MMTKAAKNLCKDYWSRRKAKETEIFFEEVETAFQEGVVKPEDFSLQDMFESLVEDGRELFRELDPRRGSRVVLFEASGVVDTSAFSNITGQILYNSFLQGYKKPSYLFSKMIPTVGTRLNGEKIAGVSGIGDEVEEVGENEPYPTIGLSENWIETPATIKRGCVGGITKEAIFFDLTGQVIRNMRAIGEAVGLNKEKRAIDCIIDQNTTKHRYKWKGSTYATYQSSGPWVNVKSSNALVDYSNVDAAEQLFDAMTDPDTGEPIDIEASVLIATRKLKYTANRILTATTVRTTTPGFATSGNPTETEWKNPIDGYSFVSNAWLKSRIDIDTTWFIGDPMKAFAYMENWGETFTPAPSNAQAEFERDVVLQYKVSERGAFATMDPRYMVKSTA